MNMKKSIFILALILTFFTSCNRKEVERLKQENQSLQNLINQKENEINSIILLLNEIEENLTGIRIREERIMKASSGIETNNNQIENIKSDVMAIDDLMKKNRENLELLSQRLKATTGEKQQLEKMINNLNSQVDRKDKEIQKLVADLYDKNLQIHELYSSITQLETEKAEIEEVIDQQDKELHRAYWIIGNSKELKKSGIIVSSGGFLGIGKSNKLADQLDPFDFNIIDIREQNIFPIEAEKAKLISLHPSDSYIMRKSDDGKKVISFEITRVEEFWKNSKFMVLSLD